mgnify:CR=1 FL=1
MGFVSHADGDMTTWDAEERRTLRIELMLDLSVLVLLVRKVNGPCRPEVRPICRLAIDARLSSKF